MSVKPTMVSDDLTGKYYHEDHSHSELFNPERATKRIMDSNISVSKSMLHSNPSTRRLQASV